MPRTVLCLLLFAASLVADDLASAQAALRAGDLAKALAIALPQAEKGAAAAQRFVGDLYWDGRGIGRDRAKSVVWYRKAADQGEAEAMLRLARAYGRDAGQGIERDYNEAADWCRKAVAKGNARAMGELGVFFLRGHGVERDRAKARAWFEKGAAKGDAFSTFQLGEVERDRKQALVHYTRAAELGHARAFTRIGDAHFLSKQRDSVTAVLWYRRAASRKDAEGQRKLGLFYLRGWGVAMDASKARGYLRMAAAQGDAEAKELLAGLAQPIRGRITKSEYVGYNKARIWIDKGSLDGVRKLARGKLKGVRADFEVRQVWPRRCMAEIRAHVNTVKASSAYVTIDR